MTPHHSEETNITLIMIFINNWYNSGSNVVWGVLSMRLFTRYEAHIYFFLFVAVEGNTWLLWFIVLFTHQPSVEWSIHFIRFCCLLLFFVFCILQLCDWLIYLFFLTFISSVINIHSDTILIFLYTILFYFNFLSCL